MFAEPLEGTSQVESYRSGYTNSVLEARMLPSVYAK